MLLAFIKIIKKQITHKDHRVYPIIFLAITGLFVIIASIP